MNYALYPTALDRPQPTSSCAEDDWDFFAQLKGVYSNLFVVMMVQIQTCSGGSIVTHSSGTRAVMRSESACSAQCRQVRIAFAESYPHEFTHAFADVLDEYLWVHDTTIDFNPAEPSVSIQRLIGVAG